jgi:hypothetical protein
MGVKQIGQTKRQCKVFADLFGTVVFWRATQDKTANTYAIEIAI